VKIRSISILLLTCVFLLSACGSPASQPTFDVNAIYTAAAQTAQAQTAQTAAVPPTKAPQATQAPLASLTAVITSTAAPSTLCDSALFVTDVTIPDGTLFAYGSSFDKVWKLKNTGTCTWNSSYFIQYENGPLPPVTAKVFLPNSVAPQQTVDVQASFTVQLNSGTNRSNWSLRNASGTIVPISNSYQQNNMFYVEINATNGSQTPTVTGTVGVLTPLIDCQTIRDNAEIALPFHWTMFDEPFTDQWTGKSGMVCHVEADGTGVDFDALGLNGVADALEGSLVGWTPNFNHYGNGATGLVRAYQRGSEVMTLSVSWSPSADANCPTNQPISSCVLTPQQRLYAIILRGWQQ
jgi:hypothetical protein